MPLPTKYIYMRRGYPNFVWDSAAVLDALARVAAAQGAMLGRMRQFGFGLQREAMLNALTEEIAKSGEIEGEILNSEQIRSSLAKRLNITLRASAQKSYHVDGIVHSAVDAVENFGAPLTKKRLFGWHAALFPTGYSGMRKISVAAYRSSGMQVVSSGKIAERVYYEAPPAESVGAQMGKFLSWIDGSSGENPLIKAAAAHLWFVIIHPFDDGNGRLARTITEMMLARAENTPLRFYSMSSQIQKEKKGYYAILEQTTTGPLDITPWLNWFLGCLERAIGASKPIVGKVIEKAAFWQKHALKITDPKEREIVNRLLDGFEGNMTSGKAAKILKVSQDTAARALNSLRAGGFLLVEGAGRSTHYVLRGGGSR